MAEEFSAFNAVRQAMAGRYAKMRYNVVWGHIIYRPTMVGQWKVPAGMNTLDEFMDFHRRRFGLEQGDGARMQGKGARPIALEIFCGITMRDVLSPSEFAVVVAELTEAVLDTYPEFGNLIALMEWGEESEETDEFIPLQAEVRYSRDGFRFEKKDLSKKLSHLEDRFGLQ